MALQTFQKFKWRENNNQIWRQQFKYFIKNWDCQAYRKLLQDEKLIAVS